MTEFNLSVCKVISINLLRYVYNGATSNRICNHFMIKSFFINTIFYDSQEIDTTERFIHYIMLSDTASQKKISAT